MFTSEDSVSSACWQICMIIKLSILSCSYTSLKKINGSDRQAKCQLGSARCASNLCSCFTWSIYTTAFTQLPPIFAHLLSELIDKQVINDWVADVVNEVAICSQCLPGDEHEKQEAER